MIFVIEGADCTGNWEPADCPDNILLASEDLDAAWRQLLAYQDDADDCGDDYRYRLLAFTEDEANAYCARWDLDGPALG